MKTNIFEYNNYKEFVNSHIESLPQKGRGFYRKLALHLNINSVMISQIFKGARDLTPEQALQISELLGMDDLSTDYFILLVQKERSSHYTFQKRLEEKLTKLKNQSLELKNKLTNEKELSEKSKLEFYSNWFYSGVRLASSIESLDSSEKIASRLNLPLSIVNQVINFLLENELCILDGKKLRMGPQRTHMGSDTLIASKFLLNWRIKGLNRIESFSKDELFYSAPMALSENLRLEIRKEIADVISRLTEKVVKSESETLSCLNIDWFKF